MKGSPVIGGASVASGKPLFGASCPPAACCRPNARCPRVDALDSKPDSPALALRLEAAVWQEIDAVQALAGKLRSRASPLPEGVQCLRPPAAVQAGAQPAAAEAAGATAEGQRASVQARPVAPPDYPALRRAQRLSFACAALLADLSATEGRQAWVEAGSTCTRLRLALAALRKHRQVLAAVVAVEGL